MNQIVKEILDEALGLGPLEDLLSDRTVSERPHLGCAAADDDDNGRCQRARAGGRGDVRRLPGPGEIGVYG